MKKFLEDYGLLIGFAGLIVLVDQLTKTWVRVNLPNEGDMWAPWSWLLPYARLIHWTNTGAAFGMFQNGSLVFTILAILVSVAILYYFPRVPWTDWPLKLAMMLQLGGALGNLVDRLTIGHVTDFVSVGNFAVFNVADACITAGVVVLIIGMWIKERDQKAEIPASEPGGLEAGQEAPASSPEEIKSE